MITSCFVLLYILLLLIIIIIIIIIIIFINIVMAPKSEIQRFTLDNIKNLTAVLDKYRGTGPVYNV